MSQNAPKMMIPRLLSFFRTKSQDALSAILKKPGKILLIKQSERLGNIILMNSSINALRNAFPESRIDLILPAAYSEIMKSNSGVNDIIPLYKRKFIVQPWKLLSLITVIRHQRYDLAIDCSDVNSHSSTGAAYTLLSGACFTAGWKISNNAVYDIEVTRYSEIIHASDMYLRLFSGIFGRRLEGQPFFSQVSKHPNLEANIIGINCGGRGPKRWPLERFIEVGSKLVSRGFKVELILGPEEENLRGLLNKNLPDGCSLLPLLSLMKLMERIKSYKLFISSDTGPMHLAWCLRVPVLAIFLDSEIDKFKPLSPGSAAIDGTHGVKLDEVIDSAIKILTSDKVPV
jgi:ADP-heptose:LPS heptosyltransferase